MRFISIRSSFSRLVTRAAVARSLAFLCLFIAPLPALAASGSIHGRVLGSDGAAMTGVSVLLRNDITGFKADTISGPDGAFQFYNVPFNPYELRAEVKGFQPFHQTVEVRSAAPQEVPISLKLAGMSESVTVTGDLNGAQLETDSSTSHVDIDKSYIARAPSTVASRAMEELITATPGFAKDENGRYHFQGFHSQGQFVIDGQTVSDQTGATFSNSIDPGIAQSMEVIYGNVPAEYGEKVGAVVNLVTKSGLSTPFHGDLSGGATRFSTFEGGGSLGGGSKNVGVFASLNASSSDRFLDPVNPDNLHNRGNTGRGFLRLDYASDNFKDQVRFTTLAGKTNRDVPNTYAQEDAGQNQQVKSHDQNFNLGWTHVISTSATFDVNASTRHSRFELLSSPNDTPVLAQSNRTLDNYSVAPSLTVFKGDHGLKFGGVFKSFPINEAFSFGITDPGFNDLNAVGFNPDLAPYDLSRHGRLLSFTGKRTGTYYGAYAQDNFKYKGLTANVGLRYDHNDLPTTEDQLQPRLGLSYYLKGTGTVLRASYNRIFVTPEYENILFGSSDLAASLVPPAIKDSRELGGGVLLVHAEHQNAYIVGIQQAMGSKLRADVDVWWRRATFPGDQDQFLNTGVVFPLSFTEGRHNGWDVRLDLAQTHGVRGFLSLGHTHAVYVPPPSGGLFLDTGVLDAITGGPFLIDHDQKLQAQGQLLVDIGQSGIWIGANVRYDSGLVTDASPDALDGDPDNTFAAPFVVVHSGEDLDPNRIKARTIANFSLGFDRIGRGVPVSIQADLLNAFDTGGVYNILSVFGGTHVIPPRTVSVRLKYSFGRAKS